MPIKTDGTVKSGTRVLTITNPSGTGITYIANTIDFSFPSQFLQQRDQYNEPLGGVLLKDFATGTATLQLSASTVILPVAGATFSEKPDLNDATATPFIITQVSKPESQAAIQLVTISFQKIYNSTGIAGLT